GQLDREFRNEPDDLKNVFVRSREGKLLPLDNLVSWDEQVVPSDIYRFDRYISATVSGGMAEGYTLGDGIRVLNEVAKQTLPPPLNTTLAGQSRDFADS